MIKRLTAMTAALILIFAVGANEKREAWGEPVKEPVAVMEEPASYQQVKYEPIKPKEVEHEGTDEIRKTYDSGDAGRSRPRGAGNAIEDVAGGDGCNRGGTVLAVIGATTEGDPVAPEGEPSDVEEYSGGDEDAEQDAVADVGQDEVVTDPEPAPEPEPAVEEPQMEYLGDFTISGYCSCGSCCGQWSGGPCADGSYPEEGYTCAMGGLDFGTVLYIDGVGYRTICDRGTDYGWVDLYFTNHDSALAWGLQTRGVYIVR